MNLDLLDKLKDYPSSFKRPGEQEAFKTLKSFVEKEDLIILNLFPNQMKAE